MFYGLGETQEEALQALEAKQRLEMESFKAKLQAWEKAKNDWNEIVKTDPRFKNPITMAGDRMIIDMPNGEHIELQDRNGSGWMIQTNWDYWAWQKSRDPKRAAELVGDYQRKATAKIDEANAVIKEQRNTISQMEKDFNAKREREGELLNQEKKQIEARFALERAAVVEQIKAMSTLEAQIQAAIEAGQINAEEAEAVRAQGLEKFLAAKEAEQKAQVAEREPAIIKAEGMLRDAAAAFARLPSQPDTRYVIRSNDTQQINKYDASGNVIQTWILHSKDGSPMMPDEDLNGWLDAKRRGNNRLVNEIGARGAENTRNIQNEVVLSDQRFKQAVQPQRTVLTEKINNLTWALQTLKLERSLTDTERTRLQQQLEIALKPIPVPPKVLFLIDTNDFRVIETPYGEFKLCNRSESGWMLEDQWHNWKADINSGNYKNSAKKKAAYQAEAKVLMEGGSPKEATEASTAAWNDMKDAQDEEDKKKGVSAIIDKASDLWEDHKGEILTVLGLIALLIPVVGLVIGPILSGAGQYVTEEEKKKLAEEVATNKQAELGALKDRLDKGELTQEQYEAEVAKIAGPEALRILEERRQQALVDRVMSNPATQKLIDDETKASAGKTAAVIGGTTVAAGLLAVLAKWIF